MSVFFSLDARVKIFFILLLTLLVFLTDSFPSVIFLLVSFIVIRLVSGVPPGSFRFFKNLTLLAAILVIIQMIFAPGDNYILKPLFPSFIPVLGGMGSLKWEGLALGLMIVCRLTALVILLPVFTETTPPARIAAGLCSLGLNYRVAFIITTAFNLVSVFKEEALVIMNAQKLRGMRKFGIKAAIGLLVPLMLGAMRKAQDSSAAMDCRAFGIYRTRTWLDRPKMKVYDYCFMAGCIVFFVCMVLFNYR